MEEGRGRGNERRERRGRSNERVVGMEGKGGAAGEGGWNLLHTRMQFSILSLHPFFGVIGYTNIESVRVGGNIT